ncbi:hypothetical protein [Pontibacter roseus]|uniref:hypothetical protein n=1 Tax=Pontibacter roseus TaxID=336989 RepID=UPI0003A66AB9|nr:hypothetical protein [Pontibacter roseus]
MCKYAWLYLSAIPIPGLRLLYLLTLLSFRRKEESVTIDAAGSSTAGTGGETCEPVCTWYNSYFPR